MKSELKDHLKQSSSKKRCNLVVPRYSHPTTASAESTVSSSVNSNEPAWPPQENYVPTPMCLLLLLSPSCHALLAQARTTMQRILLVINLFKRQGSGLQEICTLTGTSVKIEFTRDILSSPSSKMVHGRSVLEQQRSYHRAQQHVRYLP